MNKLRKLGLATFAALAVGGGAVTVWSATASSSPSETGRPTTAPAPVQAMPERRPGMRPDGGMRFGRPGEWWRERSAAATRPVGPDEFQDIDRFMNTYSKKRWSRLKEMPEERQERLRGFVAQRYRQMQELKQNDPTMYDIRLRRLPIEDEIFDLGWQLRSDPDNVDATRSKIREKVRALVDNRIEERRLRVKQLGERLETESRRLKDEEANKESVIEASLAAIDKQHWPGMGEMVPPLPGGGAPPQRPLRGGEPRNLAPANTSEQGRQ